jgi:hypothetical protein
MGFRDKKNLFQFYQFPKSFALIFLKLRLNPAGIYRKILDLTLVIGPEKFYSLKCSHINSLCLQWIF